MLKMNYHLWPIGCMFATCKASQKVFAEYEFTERADLRKAELRLWAMDCADQL